MWKLIQEVCRDKKELSMKETSSEKTNSKYVEDRIINDFINVIIKILIAH